MFILCQEWENPSVDGVQVSSSVIQICQGVFKRTLKTSTTWAVVIFYIGEKSSHRL